MWLFSATSKGGSVSFQSKLLLTVSLLVSVTTSFAQEQMDDDYYKIVKMEVKEISVDKGGREKILNSKVHSLQFGGGIGAVAGDPIERVGRVIAIARDIVALGESVYNLVERNKPSNKTEYAPIMVVPREGNQAADILDTEGWTAPVKRTYRVTYQNTYNIDVVDFTYAVMYSYKGSYNGTGAYLAGVQIVPTNVRTLWGFNFSATMKLGGIVNQGSRANPVAGATIIMEYNVSSLLVSQTVAQSFFINGRGGFKKY